MQSLCFPPLHFPATALRRRIIPTSVARSAKAELREDNDPLIQSAINSASLRLRETNRTEPLFIDPYAACFLPNHTNKEPNIHELQHYCLATKFIDDKLLQTAKRIDGLKQVVLFTDGMDTRPYRLNWPASTMIFDVSPQKVFDIASDKLQGVGARLPKGCMFFHIPVESGDIEQCLRSKGFSGNRPSIWAMQGLPLESQSSFEAILSAVSSLAINESYLIGELPTDITHQSDLKKWMEKLFMSSGLQVKIVSYEEIAASLGVVLHSQVNHDKILFIAQQLRFSDDQMEKWRQEFERVEEDGDEQGFEEL
ncbi:O-methyltransferase 1, chloroplastic [Raphanus sativus]|uniref:O-methyltransferase 1, chloroplastic n=1 Tax=Raphanus sativus TaxID=3726 RepID=A0A6J0MPZ5_RAPSA|nr:O-methyltransferase 1, chloroplastic [Raphanus sativus]